MRAGFEVVGIDKDDHSKSYPGDFIQGDIHHLPVNPMDFDLVWASPPCQAFSSMHQLGDVYREPINLIPVTRDVLKSHPWTIIENVPQSPIRRDIVLTGPMVGLYKIKRKRLFELSFFMLQPPIQNKVPKWVYDNDEFLIITTNGEYKQDHYWKRAAQGLPVKYTKEQVMDAMGITHDMTMYEMGESIPPAYAEYLGREAKRQMEGMYV